MALRKFIKLFKKGIKMGRLEALADKLRKNEYEVVIFDTKELAKDYLLNMCANKSVGIGDSHTIDEIGLIPELQAHNKELYICQLDKSFANKRKSMEADIFLLSANAVAEDSGAIVNVDSSGNRVAASLFGPLEVVYVIGKNKLTPDLPAALGRIKNVVAPKNALVHNYNTPCTKTGKCEDCSSPQRICRATVICYKKPKKTKTTIVLINEDLGF